MSVTAAGEGASAVPAPELVTFSVTSTVTAPAATGGVKVIDTLELPTAAFWQPGFMLNTKGVTADAVTLAALGSVTAVVRAVPAVIVGVTFPVVANAIN